MMNAPPSGKIVFNRRDRAPDQPEVALTLRSATLTLFYMRAAFAMPRQGWRALVTESGKPA
jgi:hypothetical protein